MPELILQKEKFQPGETLIGEISLNENEEFAENIPAGNIQFFEGRKQVYLEYDLAFYNNTYFFYVLLNKAGNFTIKINKILYKNPGLKETSIEKQVFVGKNESDETGIIEIIPGFVFTSGQPEIILKNAGNEQINLSYSYDNISEEISISPESSKKISFSPQKPFSYLKISSYEEFNIPVIYTKLGSENKPETISLKANPSYLQVKAISESESRETIEIVNFAEKNISIESIDSDADILGFSELKEVCAKSVSNLTLIINPVKTGFFRANITIEFSADGSNGKFLLIPVDIYVFPVNVSSSQMQVQANLCSDFNGILCSQDENCDGNAKFTSDGYCCIGNCIKPDEPADYSWLWGLIIIFFLGVAGFLAYKKFRSVGKKKEDKMQEKTKIYEARISGGLSRN